MSKLLNSITKLSGHVGSNLKCSLVWSGMSAYTRNYGIASDAELAQYLKLVQLTSQVKAEIRPVLAEVMERITSAPEEIGDVSDEFIAEQIELGAEDEDAVRQSLEDSYDKDMSYHEDSQRSYKKNEKVILANLKAAMGTKLAANAKFTSIAENIIIGKADEKIRDRISKLTSHIHRRYNVKASKKEMKAWYVFLRDLDKAA